jgi:hypothetical protein
MDNGCGMNEAILRSAWMNIGTNDKEERKVSPGGRIKTGAKGIGRFALDKLSISTTVYTKSEDDAFKKWQIDWRQFDTAHMLEEVSATIEDIDGSYPVLADKIAKNKVKSFDQYEWNTGTTIILSPIRESWSIPLFSKINRNLKSLFPSTNDWMKFTTPRTIGKRKNLLCFSGGVIRLDSTWIFPLGSRTAVAYAVLPFSMTPSMTAWPPMYVFFNFSFFIILFSLLGFVLFNVIIHFFQVI